MRTALRCRGSTERAPKTTVSKAGEFESEDATTLSGDEAGSAARD